MNEVIAFLNSDECPPGLRARTERANRVMSNLKANCDDEDWNNPNVRWALVDARSGVHAIKASMLPGVRQSKGKRMKCQTANGEIMEIDGEKALVSATDEGNQCNIVKGPM